LQDHPVNDRELKEKGVHGERRHQRAPRRIDAAVGAVMAHDRAALAGVTRDSV
jgi:hypothetical protein